MFLLEMYAGMRARYCECTLREARLIERICTDNAIPNCRLLNLHHELRLNRTGFPLTARQERSLLNQAIITGSRWQLT